MKFNFCNSGRRSALGWPAYIRNLMTAARVEKQSTSGEAVAFLVTAVAR